MLNHLFHHLPIILPIPTFVNLVNDSTVGGLLEAEKIWLLLALILFLLFSNALLCDRVIQSMAMKNADSG